MRGSPSRRGERRGPLHSSLGLKNCEGSHRGWVRVRGAKRKSVALLDERRRRRGRSSVAPTGCLFVSRGLVGVGNRLKGPTETRMEAKNNFWVTSAMVSLQIMRTNNSERGSEGVKDYLNKLPFLKMQIPAILR